MREIIAVDADEVLCSEVDAIIAFSKERIGLNLTYDDFKKPGDYWGYYERLWGDTGEDPYTLFKEFLTSSHKANQSILREDVAILEKLKSRYQLEIVTSRTAEFVDITNQMLGKYAADIFADVHFVSLWSDSDRKVTKAHICKEIGAGYLIDDSPEHCNLAAEVGVKALLFGDWGWSRGKELHPGVERVADWKEVAEYFGV
ncbi:MAG: hypothetical protein U5K77_01140 [Candidatus Saccharibacteria bacterium]|nr:hypothetical protein [Candidatus Saccharibacteria bacterium]